MASSSTSVESRDDAPCQSRSPRPLNRHRPFLATKTTCRERPSTCTATCFRASTTARAISTTRSRWHSRRRPTGSPRSAPRRTYATTTTFGSAELGQRRAELSAALQRGRLRHADPARRRGRRDRDRRPRRRGAVGGDARRCGPVDPARARPGSTRRRPRRGRRRAARTGVRRGRGPPRASCRRGPRVAAAAADRRGRPRAGDCGVPDRRGRVVGDGCARCRRACFTCSAAIRTPRGRDAPSR